MISQSTINRVYELPLNTVINKYVDLKKNGPNYKACCPFHDEKTGSFVVSPAKGVYKCFGCGKGGNNAVSFVIEKEGLEWIDAVKLIAENHNILIEYDSQEKAEEYRIKKQNEVELKEYNGIALDKWKQNELPKTPYTKEIIELFDIAFAPDDFKATLNALKAKNASLQKAFDIGLIKKKTNYYDAYRNRLIFPIYDIKNTLVGFTARDLSNQKEAPKYINSPDSVIYNKSEQLFGINLAKQKISLRNTAIIVEGAKDMIACYANGLENTVAPCGTALTKKQLQLLKPLCKNIWFIYDGDSAGINATKKNIKAAIAQGFNTSVTILPNGTDPDSLAFTRKVPRSVGLYNYVKEIGKTDGILWLMQFAPKAMDIAERAEFLKQTCELLSKLDDTFKREQYVKEVAATLKIKERELAKNIQIFLVKEKKDISKKFTLDEYTSGQYEVPKELGITFNDVKADILQYGMFFHENQIFMKRGGKDTDKYTFQKVSNFSIKIIQHMEDEKNPMKLVQMQNIHGRKRTFDTASEDFTSPANFVKMVTGKGNFNWQGTIIDFQRITTKLYDEMGDGRMINQLGWQPEGFWAFNNAIIEDGSINLIDEYGCFETKETSYYIPAGNRIYQYAVEKFTSEKKVKFVQSKISFETLTTQILRVHRDHAINAILFSVATVFSDVIYKNVSFFPMLFLYGEASSGKDNLIDACQSFFGSPQTPITITGKANTEKAKIRKFAQFTNMIGHLSEYSKGDDNTDQMLKSFWDRVGYERGNITSSYGTDSIPINMSIIFTGNDYPTNDALITRFIGEEMNKTSFSTDDKKQYEILKEYTLEGYSSLLVEIVKHRKAFESDFRKEFKKVGAELSSYLKDTDLPDRMIQNAAVLGATYKLTCEKLKYPFSWSKFLANIKDVYSQQANKRETGSVVSKWWDCFLINVKDGYSGLVHKKDYRIEGENLCINYKNTFNAYLKQHFNTFRAAGLSSAVMMDKLKRHESYIEHKNSYRFGMAKTSAFIFNLKQTGIQDELVAVLDITNPNDSDEF